MCMCVKAIRTGDKCVLTTPGFSLEWGEGVFYLPCLGVSIRLLTVIYNKNNYFTFTFMHLADAFIHVLSVCVFPGTLWLLYHNVPNLYSTVAHFE